MLPSPTLTPLILILTPALTAIALAQSLTDAVAGLPLFNPSQAPRFGPSSVLFPAVVTVTITVTTTAITTTNMSMSVSCQTASSSSFSPSSLASHPLVYASPSPSMPQSSSARSTLMVSNGGSVPPQTTQTTQTSNAAGLCRPGLIATGLGGLLAGLALALALA